MDFTCNFGILKAFFLKAVFMQEYVKNFCFYRKRAFSKERNLTFPEE